MPTEYTLTLSWALTNHYLTFARAVQGARHTLHSAEPPTGLTVDLQPCRFLEPGYLVTLACLIEEFHRFGLPIRFLPPNDLSADRYLRNIRFYEYWQPGFDRSQYAPTHISSALSLWQVSQPMIDSYAQQASQYFSQNYLPGRNLDSLSISLAELFNNICDHAHSPVQGYCLTQYYPKKHQLVTAVCDFGIGIPSSINNYWAAQGKDRLSDSDALRLALRRKVTTKSTPRNRGFGLDNLSNIVRSLGGHLFFLSNFATLKQNAAAEWHTQILTQPFFGSLIVVTLNTTALPDVEAELEEEEFSF
jgi:hypothetical protein